MRNRIVIAAAALCCGFVLAYLVLPQPESTPAGLTINMAPGASIPEHLPEGVSLNMAPDDIPEHLMEPKDDVYFVVEEMPELIGGMAAIVEQVQYPESAREAGLEGRVFVMFVVNEVGNVQDAVITRGAGGDLDKEAMRVVGEAKFTPGMQDGKAVKVRMTMPITFKLAQT